MHETGLSCALSAIACTATIGLWAQTPTPQRPQSNAGDTTRFVVIGCVSGGSQGSPAANRTVASSPRFLITDTRGDPPLVYRLDGDASTLQLHVGHTLEISGTLSAPSPADAGPNAAPVMKVGSLTWIATSCRKAR